MTIRIFFFIIVARGNGRAIKEEIKTFSTMTNESKLKANSNGEVGDNFYQWITFESTNNDWLAHLFPLDKLSRI